MSHTIVIKNKKISLETPCAIINGEVSRDDLEDSFKYTPFFNLHEFDLIQKKEISINQLKTFLKKLGSLGCTTISIENLEILQKIFEDCNNLLDFVEDLKKRFDTALILLDLIQSINIKTSLENELYWANIIEQESAKSVNATRLSILNDEIEDLNNKIKKIEPDYLYLKERIEKIKTEFDSSNRKVNEYNKEYMNKTREINNISREIDSILDTINLYNEKIEDIKKVIQDDSRLVNNEDYIRVKGKKDDLEVKIEQLRNIKQNLTVSNNELKSIISTNKTELEKLKKGLSEIEPKFKKVNESYQELSSQLKIKTKELDEVKTSVINEKIDEKTAKSETLNRKKPEMIRYSNIIKQELLETNIIIQNLKDSMGLDNETTKDMEKIILTFRQNLRDIKVFLNSKSIKNVNINDLITPLGFFNKDMPIIEKFINLFLSHIDLQVKIDNSLIRVIKEENISRRVKIGIGIILLNSKTNKEVNYDDLPNYKKLYVSICFEVALSSYAKMDNAILFESDMDPNIYSKANLIKILKILNEIVVNSNEFKDIKLIFCNSNLKIKEDEIEGVKIFYLNDEEV